MDTYSLAGAARQLGTSSPRVRRAVDRLGMSVQRDAAGVFHLTEQQVHELARELGVIPPLHDLPRTDAQVLAALSRSPRGVASVREAARRAGVSPTAAGRALTRLTAQSLIERTPMMLAQGSTSEVTVYRVRFASQEWLAIAPEIAKIRLRSRSDRPHAKRVPPRLLHLFWNSAPAQLDTATSAPYIARRLITTFDPDGLAWGAANLPASAWEHAAATRGLEPAKRALAHNLARHADDPL
jgi:DNA-binding Lrp family transcriptional regulator